MDVDDHLLTWPSCWSVRSSDVGAKVKCRKVISSMASNYSHRYDLPAPDQSYVSSGGAEVRLNVQETKRLYTYLNIDGDFLFKSGI